MNLYFMITIAIRSRLPELIGVYHENNVNVNFVTLGHGTAKSDILSYLGLESSEMAVCFAVVTDETWKSTKKVLERRIRIDVPGTGIAFIVPMSSIGGKRELMFLTDGQEFEKGEESTLKDTNHELLVIIAREGYSELVMDAAREAGAGGGTLIHARGTGMERAEKFLGIRLTSERDIIFVVTRTEQKNDIMQAIMKNAGTGTKANAVVFSLPVTDTAGLRLMED